MPSSAGSDQPDEEDNAAPSVSSLEEPESPTTSRPPVFAVSHHDGENMSEMKPWEEITSAAPEYRNPPCTPTPEGKTNKGYVPTERKAKKGRSSGAASSDSAGAVPYSYHGEDFTDLATIDPDREPLPFVHEYEKSDRLCASLPPWFGLGLLAVVVGTIAFLAGFVMIIVGFAGGPENLRIHGFVFLALGILLCVVGYFYFIVVVSKHKKFIERGKKNEARRREGRHTVKQEKSQEEINNINRLFRAKQVKRKDLWS